MTSIFKWIFIRGPHKYIPGPFLHLAQMGQDINYSFLKLGLKIILIFETERLTTLHAMWLKALSWQKFVHSLEPLCACQSWLPCHFGWWEQVILEQITLHNAGKCIIVQEPNQSGRHLWMRTSTLISHFIEYGHVQICDEGGNGTKLIHCKDGNTANSKYYFNFHNILCLLYSQAQLLSAVNELKLRLRNTAHVFC
jgi:hypothetical protein